MNKDLMEKSYDEVQKLKASTKNLFQSSLNYILILFLLIVVVITSLATVAFQGVTKEYILSTIILSVYCVIAFVVFIPQGKTSEKRRSESYFPNRISWGESVSRLRREHLLTAFNNYCKELEKNQIKEKRAQLLVSASIDESLFYNKYFKLSKKELKELIKTKEITAVQYRLLKKACGKIKVAKLNPTLVTSGIESKDKLESVKVKKIRYQDIMLISRIISVIVLGIITASITIVPTGASGWSAVFIILMRMFTVLTSAVSGFYTGINQIKIDDGLVKERIIFIDTFFENIQNNMANTKSDESNETAVNELNI